MKKNLNPFQGSLSGISLFCLSIYSAFITLFILHEAAKLVSFELTDLSTLYVGEATAWGIDVSARVKWMYRFLIAAAGLFLIIFFLLRRGLKNSCEKLIKHEDLLIFGISGIILCLMKIFGTDSTHVLSSLFFLFSFKLVLFVLSENKIRISPYFLNSGIFNLSVSFGFLLMFGCVFLFGISSIVHKNYSSILFIGTLFFMCYYSLMLGQFKISARKATSFLLPLIGIPFMALLSVESFFYKRIVSNVASTYQHNFLGLYLIFVIIVIALLFISRKKRSSSLKQYKRYLIPALLMCFVMITSYEPVIDHNPDMFEPANILTSIQRVFEFGQVPVIDFMSSHMLSEQWYGYIYSAIFGFHGDQSPLSYNFLNSFIFTYILYTFLLRMFKRETYALAFIFFFPFISEVFSATMIVALVPLFLIQKLFERPSPFRVFILILTCFSLVLWRIDTGVVAIFGSAIFLPLAYFVSSEKIPLKIFLKGIAYFFGFALLVFVALSLCFGPTKLFDSFQQFYHYVAGSQGHGHSYLFQAEAHQFYLYHFLYPVLAVGMCLLALYWLKTKYSTEIFRNGYLLATSLFLFLLYIVHLQRGLVRHGFAELDDRYIISVFHVSTAIFIAFAAIKKAGIQRYAVFYSSTFILLLLIKYFVVSFGKIPLENGITGQRFYNVEKPFDDPLIQGRIKMDTAFARNNYTHIKNFMDKYLDREQTFFDFSNTSMLYYYCKRKIPSYYNQIPISAIDEFLQLRSLSDLDTEKIPLVIYSNAPPNPNDALDEIPNVMRHTIYAEYIFKHYRPIGVLDHKSIWATPKFIAKLTDSLPADPYSYKPQQFNYLYTAEYIGYYYSEKNSTDLESVYKTQVKNLAVNDGSFVFKLSDDLNKIEHCYLRLEYKKSVQDLKPNHITVQLLNDSSEVNGTFSFERRDKVSSKYMLRLSNHYLWHIKKISALKITNDPDLISLELLKDKRTEYKNANSH